MKRVLSIGLFLAFTCVTVDAASILSRSGRFRVGGFDPPAHLVMAEWADDIADRLESMTGLPVPADGVPIRIIGVNDSTKPAGAFPAQGWLEGFLQQKLFVVNPGKVDQEAVLESMVWLMLNRMAAMEQTPAQRRNGLADFPAWISIGTAQDLYTVLRHRNSRMALSVLEKNLLPTQEEIPAWEDLGELRSRKRGLVGVYMGYLTQHLERRNGWGVLLKAVAAGEVIDFKWIVNHALQLNPGTTVYDDWVEWIEAQQDVVRISDGLRADDLDFLEEVILEKLGRFLVPPGEGPVEKLAYLDPGTEGLRAALDDVLQEFRVKLLGLSSEVQPVLETYTEFLSALLGQGDDGLSMRMEKLKKARVMRDELKYRLTIRKRYLDDFQARAEAPSMEPVGVEGIDWRMGRAWRAERYLDRLEKKLGLDDKPTAEVQPL